MSTSAPVLRRVCALCSLRGWCWSPQLDEPDLARVHAAVQRTGPLPAGHHVFRANDIFTAIYAVRGGCIKTYSTDQRGKEYVHGFHLAGELLGFDAVYPEAHRFSAQVLEDSMVCIVTFRDMAELSRQIPGLDSHILTLIGREYSRNLILTRGSDATEKIAKFLLDIEARMRRSHRVDFELDLPMSREDIASYLRFSPETLSRLLSKLHRLDIIAVDRRHIRLIDIARLEQITQGEPVFAEEQAD